MPIFIVRVKLKEGKQKELILLAKKDLTWKKLSSMLGINAHYLAVDLKNERGLLSKTIYFGLCKIVGINFDKFILEKLEDNWGKSKGGLNSEGSTIKLNKPIYDEKLAEFVGAILGDGNLTYYKRGKKIGVYHVRIAGDLKLDKDYHINYLWKLCEKMFNVVPSEIIRPKVNERFLSLTSKELVNFFGEMGMKPGNKIKNQSTIPEWIYKNDLYLRACLRGLIDTDGSIFRMSNKDPHLLRINFTNYDGTLLKDARNSFIRLGFHPSKIIMDRVFYISRQNEIKKYLKEIGFSNKKHIDRLKSFQSSMV